MMRLEFTPPRLQQLHTTWRRGVTRDIYGEALYKVMRLGRVLRGAYRYRVRYLSLVLIDKSFPYFAVLWKVISVLCVFCAKPARLILIQVGQASSVRALPLRVARESRRQETGE